MKSRARPAARFILLFLALCAVAPACARAEPVVPDEAALKAAFLFNFAKFIEWPDDRLRDGLQLCILGNDSVRHAMGSLDGKKVQGVTVSVRHPPVVAGGSGCDMVFMAAGYGRAHRDTGGVPSFHGVVTVGDRIQFARGGGVIAFTPTPPRQAGSRATRLGFAINIEAAHAAGVVLRSSLLKLATVVKTSG